MNDDNNVSDRLRIGILADDLTGACDCGGQFSNRGARVLVAWKTNSNSLSGLRDWDVLLINTESRPVEPEKAGQLVQEGVRNLEKAGYSFLYKKIDSTLRGNMWEEIKPLLEGGRSRVVIAPSFPLLDRKLAKGILYVNGIPVHLTEFGRDRLTPVPHSNLPKILEEGLDRNVGTIETNVIEVGEKGLLKKIRQLWERGICLVVPDSMNQSHLTCLAKVLVLTWKSVTSETIPALAVGSAGLARELAAVLFPEEAVQIPKMSRISDRIRPVLVVAGSRTHVTIRQTVALIDLPTTFTLALDPTSIPLPQAPEKVRIWAEKQLEPIRKSIDGGNSALLLTVRPDCIEGSNPSESAVEFQKRSLALNHAFGVLSAKIADSIPLAGLVLTGGDTARAVLDALQVSALRLGPELFTGIPLSFTFDGTHPGLPIVTKAGGFGESDALIVASDTISSLPPDSTSWMN